jgi:hypothetical protein
MSAGGLLPIERVLRHGNIPLLVSVPEGKRCQLGIPTGPVAATRYMVLEVPRESVLDLELGLVSLHELVAIGEPCGLLDLDLAKVQELGRRAGGRGASLSPDHADSQLEAMP